MIKDSAKKKITAPQNSMLFIPKVQNNPSILPEIKKGNMVKDDAGTNKT